MPVSLVDLESAIRSALPVQHLDIEDQSSGCGENYAIILVSEVSRAPTRLCSLADDHQAFEGKTTLARHRWSAVLQIL